jgi:hypothetical protein
MMTHKKEGRKIRTADASTTAMYHFSSILPTVGVMFFNLYGTIHTSAANV